MKKVKEKRYRKANKDFAHAHFGPSQLTGPNEKSVSRGFCEAQRVVR